MTNQDSLALTKLFKLVRAGTQMIFYRFACTINDHHIFKMYVIF